MINHELIETSSLPLCEVNFDIELRVDVSSEDGVKTFLSELNESSGCTFNVKTGRPDKRPIGEKSRSTFRGYRKCCMNVAAKGSTPHQEGKNTDCPASFDFRLETPSSEKEEKRKEKEEFPLWLSVHFNHNHSLH